MICFSNIFNYMVFHPSNYISSQFFFWLLLFKKLDCSSYGVCHTLDFTNCITTVCLVCSSVPFIFYELIVRSSGLIIFRLDCLGTLFL